MKALFIFTLLPFLCLSQKDPIQSVGSAVTYVVTCPCKLFKHYEKGGLVYFCEDIENSINYMIREQKYKDGIDRVLNVLNQNLYGNHKHLSDSIMATSKDSILNQYLKENPNGIEVDFMNSKAVMVREDNIQKLFFLDENANMSFDVIVSGTNTNIVKSRFNELINSLMVKSKNFKKIF
tara:strand:+ start:9082 stop:9618 length:537 start_codon:yes stop_codon:yes gene_type:complete